MHACKLYQRADPRIDAVWPYRVTLGSMHPQSDTSRWALWARAHTGWSGARVESCGTPPPAACRLAAFDSVPCRAVEDTVTGQRLAIKKVANVFDVLTDARRTLREIKVGQALVALPPDHGVLTLCGNS